MRREPETPSQRWNEIESLFHAALGKPVARRSAFVAGACRGDVDLANEVNRLLASHHDNDSFIEPPPAALTPPVSNAACGELPANTRVGPFELIRVIASGGMGTVYEAIQQQPRRTVALKVLHTGHATGAALQRFQHESQLLARLRHPAIAQVYAAGTFGEGSTGTPYFAMEYIPEAKSIVEYAESHDLEIGRRLPLFATVCDAVHHGHQHGVIHRDLKPANIIVDRNGRPKVIDFGVARVTDADLAITMVPTRTGQLIGTLAYMSPEQCAGDPSSIDTRTDVYSLGVVLYELLCGCLPYEVRNRPIPDAARTVRDDPPRRPSAVNPDLRAAISTPSSSRRSKKSRPAGTTPPRNSPATCDAASTTNPSSPDRPACPTISDSLPDAIARPSPPSQRC